MADDNHVAQLKTGAANWNTWRKENRRISPDLSGANLSRTDLGAAQLSGAKLTRADVSGAKLSNADFRGADFSGANLITADLNGADLSGAKLIGAKLTRADLTGAKLSNADFRGADLSGAKLSGVSLGGANLRGASLGGANLSGADLRGTNLSRANLKLTDLSRANLGGANLRGANLRGANLSGANLLKAELIAANLLMAYLDGANLSEANLRSAILVSTDLTGADLTGCRIFGVSAWDLKLNGVKQQNLVITRENEPEITVDNIEVAQFVYLLLHNEKIRDVIDTIGKKGVLLLGRFTAGRIQILERLREKLRGLGFVPMVLNFDKPDTKDFTETVRLLANLCRFVIVDITNPRSTPLEIQATVPDYTVPFVAILEEGQDAFAMFVDIQNKYDWVL
jgi:uncharacterized protein YjbI with pentapeptide repeats